MGKFQRKKRNQKRFLSILLSAALVMQNGVPALAEESTLMSEDEESTEKTVVDGTAEEHQEESQEDENVQETVEDESSTTEAVKDTASEETSTAESVSTAESESAAEESGSSEESSAEAASTEDSSAEESTTEQETMTEDNSAEEEEETATEEISADAGESTNAEGGNVLKNGSFESTTVTTGKSWKNDIVPTDYGTIWKSVAGTGGMSFSIEDSADAKDGGKVFHISSTDKTARWGLPQDRVSIDSGKKYVCSFWVKAKNVVSETGFSLVAKRQLSTGTTKESLSSVKITGNIEEWTPYQFELDLPFENTDVMQLVIMAEYMTGDVWIDDIRITPIEEEGSLSINKTTLTLTPEKTYKLIVSGAEGETIAWTSDNEEVATVDSDGLVTAVSEGKATITATVNDKKVSCTITE